MAIISMGEGFLPLIFLNIREIPTTRAKIIIPLRSIFNAKSLLPTPRRTLKKRVAAVPRIRETTAGRTPERNA